MNTEAKIEKIEAEIAEHVTRRKEQERRKLTALADLSDAKPGSPAYASATAERNEADNLITLLSTNESEALAKLEALKLRQAIMSDPSIVGDLDKAIDDAIALRGQMDKHLASLAKKYKAAMTELRKLSDVHNQLLQIDTRFDEAGTGRMSVSAWMRSQAGFFTGEASQFSQSHTPELPGTGFSHPTTIQRNIRERFEARAVREARKRMLSGEGGEDAA